MREVEKTIVELGSLFQRLTGMIHEQQDMVERIDEDVEAARGDAEAGGDQLNTAYENASSGKTFVTAARDASGYGSCGLWSNARGQPRRGREPQI